MVDETIPEPQTNPPDPATEAPEDQATPIETASSQGTETEPEAAKPVTANAEPEAVEPVTANAAPEAADPVTASAAPESIEPENVASEKQERRDSPPLPVAASDDSTDVGTISEEPLGAPTPAVPQRRAGDWQTEMSARRLAIELRGIEKQIRDLLQDRDTRRRRKLAGTYRWRELEEDLVEWRYNRRIDPDTVNEIQRLVCRRHFLFTQLRFAAATRPTWNS